jgi:hypothetical protein
MSMVKCNCAAKFLNNHSEDIECMCMFPRDAKKPFIGANTGQLQWRIGALGSSSSSKVLGSNSTYSQQSAMKSEPAEESADPTQPTRVWPTQWPTTRLDLNLQELILLARIFFSQKKGRRRQLESSTSPRNLFSRRLAMATTGTIWKARQSNEISPSLFLWFWKPDYCRKAPCGNHDSALPRAKPYRDRHLTGALSRVRDPFAEFRHASRI